jgi:hypothetical protein
MLKQKSRFPFSQQQKKTRFLGHEDRGNGFERLLRRTYRLRDVRAFSAAPCKRTWTVSFSPRKQEDRETSNSMARHKPLDASAAIHWQPKFGSEICRRGQHPYPPACPSSLSGSRLSMAYMPLIIQITFSLCYNSTMMPSPTPFIATSGVVRFGRCLPEASADSGVLARTCQHLDMYCSMSVSSAMPTSNNDMTYLAICVGKFEVLNLDQYDHFWRDR